MSLWHSGVGMIIILFLAVTTPGLALAAQETTNPPTLRPNESLHTLSYDVFSSDELINSELLGAPVISEDGSSAIYAINRTDGPDGSLVGHVYRVLLPQGEPTEIATVGASPQIDVDYSGTAVLLRTLPATGNALYVADLSQTRLIFEEDNGIELMDAVINREGRVVYFTIRTNTRAVGVEEPLGAGLWAIDASGDNLRPVVLLDNIRDLIGATESDRLSVPDTLTMDVTATADRAVFALRNDSTGEWFVISSLGNGSQARVLHGPSEFVFRATISGSGSTVFIADVELDDTTRTPRFTVVGPEGGSPRVLEAVLAGGVGVSNRGLMLSYDGSILLAGGTGALVYTSDGTTRSLLPGCSALSQIPGFLTAPTMSGTGHRVLFLGPVPGGNRLVSIDVQTESALFAPNDNPVTVDPVVVSAGDDNLMISVTENEPEAQVCVTLRQGETDLGDSLGLNDDGELGDTIASDARYSRDNISVPSEASTGDVTVRIAIETADPSGLRTTTMFDLDSALSVR